MVLLSIWMVQNSGSLQLVSERGSSQNLAYMVNLFTESLSLELNLFLLTRFPLNFGMSLGSEIHSVSPYLYSFDSGVSHNSIEWFVKGVKTPFQLALTHRRFLYPRFTMLLYLVMPNSISPTIECRIASEFYTDLILESWLTGKGRPRFIEVYPSSIL